MSRYAIVVVEDQPLTVDALAHRAGMHPALVERMVELALIEPVERRGATLLFDASVLPRLRMIGRLRESLGINLAGISVVLDLRDKLCALQRDYESLRRRI